MTERPWDHEAAKRIVASMTTSEKISLVDGRAGFPVGTDGELVTEPPGGLDRASYPAPGAVGCDGYTPAVDRLGIPALHLCGAGVGLTDMYTQRRDLAESTVFPSAMAQTASWDPSITYAFGAALAREARAVGVNVLLAGACNLAVEPWCGRLFEYHGEDPLLSGIMVAGEINGSQDEGVLASIKHYAANFQETGRFFIDTVVSERNLRQGELRVFETALEHCDPAAVMAAYNRINGTYACENGYLIGTVLKGEWGYPGWVMSDWGATHSTVASALAGLDQEFPMGHFFSQQLADAIQAGQVPESRLDDMCARILAPALTLPPAELVPLDVERSLAAAEQIAERSIVLLSNDGVLPLDPSTPGTVLLVGGNADRAVLSGAGSAAVQPRGGDPINGERTDYNAFNRVTWVPSSPLAALRAVMPAWEVEHLPTDDIDAVLNRARDVDLVVVVATQHTSEGSDLPDLSLPDEQDALIEAIADATDDVIVVLQTGGPVHTPWARRVRAVLEAWYPGHRGAQALASILIGAVNPSGRLPVTFPASSDQLVRPGPVPIPIRPGSERPEKVPPHGNFDWVDQPFEVRYDEPVGYQRYDQDGLVPAFCFGHGLSYSQFSSGEVTLTPESDAVVVEAELTNTGDVAGIEVVQVYVALPPEAGEPPLRLAGWSIEPLEAGASTRVTVRVPRHRLATWDVEAQRWQLQGGTYTFRVGASSRDLPRSATIDLPESQLPTLAERRRST